MLCSELMQDDIASRISRNTCHLPYLLISRSRPLPGMANHFYRERVNQHLLIGLRTIERLREAGLDQLHSRKLRSFAEEGFSSLSGLYPTFHGRGLPDRWRAPSAAQWLFVTVTRASPVTWQHMT
jgi:hypothetical protein